MKITIIGGGNMGAAIALGLAAGNIFEAENIYVTDPSQLAIDRIKDANSNIQAMVGDYSSIASSDIVLIAVKPWLVQEVLASVRDELTDKQIVISIAAGVSLALLQDYLSKPVPLFRLAPNTAIAVRQSMTFIASVNATDEQEKLVLDVFNELGKAEIIKESLIPAATSLASCGIAYAFRYIRAAMEGGVELGLYPVQAKDIVIQTLRGAIDLLDANNSHPEIEIDKVTTAGGITIKGLNEMEEAGFTAAVIRGLKASTPK
ncbi:MAG: pyrroline-5-carboxylate reductase [Prevotella sp.]|nr:pyrroline-5-carboxylate reductase [Prevotella sp.]